MGLDGGTYITRTDVLRGQSWAYAQADSTRSTRGGAAGASTVYRPRKMDQQTERWACSVVTSHQQCRAMSVCTSILPFQLRRSRGKCPLRLAQSALMAACPVQSHQTQAGSQHLDPAAHRHTKWTTCALSGQPLAVPIAADWLGRLYNREVGCVLVLQPVHWLITLSPHDVMR